MMKVKLLTVRLNWNHLVSIIDRNPEKLETVLQNVSDHNLETSLLDLAKNKYMYDKPI